MQETICQYKAIKGKQKKEDWRQKIDKRFPNIRTIKATTILITQPVEN